MLDTAATIVALCTAPGASERAVIRLSGPRALEIGCTVSNLVSDAPGAVSVTYAVAGVTFPGSVYVFRAPRSYTGEDVAELHFPGNPVIVRWLIEACLAAGARQAEAGEFTARAFFAGKLTIDQAEGVAAAIHAENAAELAAARQLMAGELARGLRPIVDDIAAVLALVEAGIDFSEEEVKFISDAHLAARLASISAMLTTLVTRSARFQPLRQEPVVVLTGAANAGKSTLLNALVGNERALVSPVAGTTRDALTARVRLARGHLLLTDVAGFERPAEALSAGEAEVARAMRATTLRSIDEADIVVLVLDRGRSVGALPFNRKPDLVVASKADLGDVESGDIAVSARSGSGLDALRAALDEHAFATPASSGGVALNQRHRAALADCQTALARASSTAGSELIAADLRVALDALGSVTGAVTPDDVIGRIFAGFCIGK